MATKKLACATCGGKTTKATPKMRGGGKVATMKTKKYALAGTVSKTGVTDTCKEGDPKCKDPKYSKGTKMEPNKPTFKSVVKGIGTKLKNIGSKSIKLT